MIGGGIGVGVVGLGGMGTLHARSVRDLGAEVVAGADLVPEQRDRFAEEFGARTYETHDDLLEDDAVDAVIVTTPNRFHEPIAVSALEASCDVLVEKPLAHTLESAERIAETAARADGICMVGFHNRHAASMAMFDEQHARGRFGDLTHVEADYVRRRGVPGPGSWFTDSELAGGGALLDIGVHALDLALYALDFPEIAEVSGVTRTTFGTSEEYADPEGFGDNWDAEAETYEVDDSVSAFIRTDDGRTISLEAAWATNREESMDFKVRGTAAGAQFDIGDTNLRIFESGTAGSDHYTDVEMTGDTAMTGYAEQDEQFLEAVAAGTTPESNTVEEALTVQRVIDAIYRSSESGRSVTLAESTLTDAKIERATRLE
ncbi:oxidoreductase domain protein [Natrinema pellirubrum DSM 15624]|uniref:Dehydrogenase n=1 Tax=Natrinema pellirubrum (strain DSM 15624 / CIP 106293 / JCM 10476 / NCIMB 786 / 157) TaxID=797303 RepID=L0JPU6_NATP1|nr:Gfo/Idh/MocA family oxidoreductase [Natrinema pellirubrum]AGB32386.1 putative dehydrogenase [Natrinema pellirubrum DSM 15624]ELY73969.1 oxidoreductase domain protein [Natrinema pellirubrum DSM 15624]